MNEGMNMNLSQNITRQPPEWCYKRTVSSIHDSLDIWDTNDDPVVVSGFKKRW